MRIPSHVPDPDAGQASPVLPMVYVNDGPVWKYRQLGRNLTQQDAPLEEELNALEAEG